MPHSPPQRALWPGLGEGSSTRPEGLGGRGGGRSELLKLEEQMENQMKKTSAGPAVLERCSFALCGFALQPLCVAGGLLCLLAGRLLGS